MSETNAVAKIGGVADVVSYVPFGGRTEIELSVAIIKNMIAPKTKKGKLPSDIDCAKFMMLCQAKELNPWEGDAFLVGYDTDDGPVFSQITAHQALMKRAEACEGYDGLESGVVLLNSKNEMIEFVGDIVPAGHKLVGGWAKVFRKDRGRPMYKRIPLDAFQKNNQFWSGSKAAGMIVKCAEADALRASFPNKLSQMYVEGERQPQREESNEGNARVIQTLHGKIDAQIAGESSNGNGHTEPDQREVESLQLRLTELMKGLSNEEIKTMKLDKAIEKAGGVEGLSVEQVNKAISLIEKHGAAKVDAAK